MRIHRKIEESQEVQKYKAKQARGGNQSINSSEATTKKR